MNQLSKFQIVLAFLFIPDFSFAQWYPAGNTIISPSDYLGTNTSSDQSLKIRTSSYTDNNIEFQTNGANTRMTILGSNGNVGIGTATPANLLQVSGGFIDVSANKGYKLGDKLMLQDYGNHLNVHLGYESGLTSNGEENTFAGHQSGYSNNGGAGNTFIGSGAGYANVDASENTFVGLDAGRNNTTGEDNVAIGTHAGLYNQTGSHNVLIGDWAGYGASTQSYSGNTFVGPYSGKSNTTAANGSFYGYNSGYNNTTGAENAHFGYNSGLNNSTGSYNTTLGYEAGKGVASNNYSYNTFLGNHSGRVNTTGQKNVFVGMNTGYNNSTGQYNSSIGYNAGVSNTTGTQNSLLGYQAGYSSTTGTGNTNIGSLSGYSSTTGGSNTFVGASSGYSSTTAYYNTLIGADAGYSISTSFYNTAVGYQASYTTSNGYNTALGNIAGYNNSGGDRNTYLGYGTDATGGGNYTNSTALGYNATFAVSNKIRLGNTSVTVIEGTPANYTSSDGRFKFNVTEDVKGLEFIKKLRPVSYQINTQQFDEFLHPINTNGQGGITDSTGAITNPNQLVSTIDYTSSTNLIRTGFIAQEVEEAVIATNFVTDIVHKPENEFDNYSLAYAGFVVPLVKAVQEQQDSISDLKTNLADLKNSFEEYKHNERGNLQNRIDTIASLLKRLNNLEEAVKQCCAAPAQHRLEGDGNENGGLSYTSNATEQPNLMQNIPNPFSTNTSITYYLPQGVQNAQLKIYNLQGEELRVFQLSGVGYGKVNIQGGSLSAGNYNYSLTIDGQNYQTKTMVLTK